MTTTSWKKLLTGACEQNCEEYEDLEEISISDEEMAREFVNSYGMGHAPGFTAWSEFTVYSDHDYDGLSDVQCVQRNPPNFWEKFWDNADPLPETEEIKGANAESGTDEQSRTDPQSATDDISIG